MTAELVYVNYGVPADYEELERRGIDVKGKIVIARYGGSWRGIKPKVAAEHGAIGCLIYSDPREDGYFQGDVYPKGGWRSDRAAQRGSVMDMPMYPGDPLTPGVGATKDAKRPPFKEAATLTKIPVLPISYADAQPLLKALGGPMAPAAWRGALPLAYHIGPGPARVHLKLEFDWKLATTYNVIATLKGSELPDQWIVRGNHHDAWVNGASDPVSGMVAVMEEARAIGVLAKTGWKPKRTIVFAAWDGEEQALLGSTEWVEDHAAGARARKAVAYINSDMQRPRPARRRRLAQPRTVRQRDRRRSSRIRPRAARSAIACIASAILERHAGAAHRAARARGCSRSTRSAPAPTTARSCSTSASPRSTSASAARAPTASTTRSTTRSRTSSASWIPTTPTASRWPRSAGARCCGWPTPTCCRSSSRAPPAASRPTSPTSRSWRTRCAPRRPSTTAASTTASSRWPPTRPTKVATPKRREPVPAFDFAPLTNAVERLTVAARRYDAKAGAAVAAGAAGASIAAANGVLLTAERALTRKEGLPRRPWFRHQIYAPGFYTGYGVKTLPAVREAIEERDFAEATAQIPKVAATIEAYAAEIEKAAAAFER